MERFLSGLWSMFTAGRFDFMLEHWAGIAFFIMLAAFVVDQLLCYLHSGVETLPVKLVLLVVRGVRALWRLVRLRLIPLLRGNGSDRSDEMRFQLAQQRRLAEERQPAARVMPCEAPFTAAAAVNTSRVSAQLVTGAYDAAAPRPTATDDMPDLPPSDGATLDTPTAAAQAAMLPLRTSHFDWRMQAYPGESTAASTSEDPAESPAVSLAPTEASDRAAEPAPEGGSGEPSTRQFHAAADADGQN